jgi:Raf kinase inhibitor-like YbhB/YbcL family protein
VHAPTVANYSEEFCVRVQILGVAILAVCMSGAACGAEHGMFSLSSPDFPSGSQIPQQFVLNGAGCTGGNLSPALEWSGAPPGTKSYVITLFDPSERNTPSGWWHWVVYDIPGATTGLPRGQGTEHSKTLPAGTLQGRSDLGVEAYHGPCPDKGDHPHHYTFTIYALSISKLPVPRGANGALVTSSLHGYILAKATLIANHRR